MTSAAAAATVIVPQAPSGNCKDPSEPKPRAAPTGKLTVRSDPPGAMVIWKGKQIGSTPLEGATIEAETQELLLVLPRYEPIFDAVTVRAGELNVIRRSFTRPTTATTCPPSAPRGYSSEPAPPSRCDHGDCVSECDKERSDCGFSDLCEKLHSGCVARCNRLCR